MEHDDVGGVDGVAVDGEVAEAAIDAPLEAVVTEELARGRGLVVFDSFERAAAAFAR